MRRGFHDIDSRSWVVDSIWITAWVRQDSQSGLSAWLHALEFDGDRNVCAVGGVEDGSLPDHGVSGIILSSNVVERSKIGVRRQSMRDRMVSEQGPDVPADGAGRGAGVVLEESHGPLPSVRVANDRCVERSGDSVGVPFVADHTDCLANGADPPWKWVETAVPAGASVGVGCCDFTDDVADVVVESIELCDL